MAGNDSSSRTRIALALEKLDRLTVELGSAHAAADVMSTLAHAGALASLRKETLVCMLAELEARLSSARAIVSAAALARHMGGTHG